jgi:hypothetical protein
MGCFPVHKGGENQRNQSLRRKLVKQREIAENVVRKVRQPPLYGYLSGKLACTRSMPRMRGIADPDR